MDVSIVIPTYNRAQYILRAVESALAASSPGDEIIVVDDGSTDNTEEILKAYQDRVQYFKIQHGGVGKARNDGINKAKNPLVAFLDSDDEWMSDKLYLQRMIMQNRSEVVFSFSDFATIYDSGEVGRCHLSTWDEGAPSWRSLLGAGIPFSSIATLPQDRQDFLFYIGNLYVPLMTKPYMPTFTFMVRKDIAGGHFRFSEDLSIFEDWECFGQIARLGPAVYLDCETTWYYHHKGPRITGTDKQRRAKNGTVVLERVWGSDDKLSETHKKLLEEQRLARLRELISLGLTKEARAELRNIEKCPLSYQFLAALPSFLMRGLLTIRHTVRKITVLGEIRTRKAKVH